MKNTTAMEPFIATNLRGYVEGDQTENKLCGAFFIWRWWHGVTNDPGLDELEAITGLSRSTVYRSLKGMKKKDWVASDYGKDGKLKFRLTIPPMDWKEAKAVMKKRLPAQPFDDPQFDLFDEKTIGQFDTPKKSKRPKGAVKMTDPIYKVGFKDLHSKNESLKTGSQPRFRAGREEHPKDQGHRTSQPNDRMPPELKEVLARLLETKNPKPKEAAA